MNIFMKVGNLLGTPKKKPLTIHDLTVKVGDYKTINEGDPEMKEDPEFPLQMMKEALYNNNTIEGNVVQGTYVYYPNKRKPKMWIGNYKILNPEDILCKSIAAKIGMTEEEWKNYVEKKRRDSEDNGMKKGKEYPSYSNTIDEKDNIKNIMENSNLQYEYDTEYMNNAEISYDNYYNDNEQINLQKSLDLKEYNENSPNKDNSYYPDETNYNKNMFDNKAYVKKLNEEIDQIREEQVKMIEKQRDDILIYSNSQSNQIIHINDEEENIEVVEESIPIKSESVELKKSVSSTPEKRKSILKNKNSYTIKPVFSHVSNLKKNGKVSKEYTNLTSMSTKPSLTINENKNEKIKKISRGTIRNLVH